jgi:FAD:protein FMN transferase
MMQNRLYRQGQLTSAAGETVHKPAQFFKRGALHVGGEAGMKKKPLLKKLMLAFMVAGAVFLVLLGIRYYNQYRFHLEKQTRFMMDTYVTIYAVGPEKVTAPAINAALDRMQEIDTKFNALNPESPVYAFNHKGVPISDPEIIDVVRLALKIAQDSDGAFDITIAPLIELWGFYDKSPRLPGEDEIKACLSKVGYQYLSLSSATLQKSKKDVQIELGGIAKGYAVSQAAGALKTEGVTSALIDAGGDVYALGKKGHDPWKVGIRSPRGDNILGYVEVEDLAVMGSGDYERFFIKDGKRYHHIFNPKTGYPVEGLSGTTLIHPDPMIADAWNTAVFVLGPDKGLKKVEKISDMETIMVTTTGEIIISTGLKNALHELKTE